MPVEHWSFQHLYLMAGVVLWSGILEITHDIQNFVVFYQLTDRF